MEEEDLGISDLNLLFLTLKSPEGNFRERLLNSWTSRGLLQHWWTRTDPNAWFNMVAAILEVHRKKINTLSMQATDVHPNEEHVLPFGWNKFKKHITDHIGQSKYIYQAYAGRTMRLHTQGSSIRQHRFLRTPNKTQLATNRIMKIIKWTNLARSRWGKIHRIWKLQRNRIRRMKDWKIVPGFIGSSGRSETGKLQTMLSRLLRSWRRRRWRREREGLRGGGGYHENIEEMVGEFSVVASMRRTRTAQMLYWVLFWWRWRVLTTPFSLWAPFGSPNFVLFGSFRLI